MKVPSRTLRFFSVEAGNSPPTGAKFPCVVLRADTWNDFGYCTTWRVYVYSSKDTLVLDSTVKILKKKSDSDSAEIRTPLPDRFTALADDYCSLGCDLEYYKSLLLAGPKLYKRFFLAMRDVALFPKIAAEFRMLSAFKDSLLRFSEAEKAFREARSLFRKKKKPSASLQFSFQCTVPGADAPHKVAFDFSKHATGLHRTTVLIGKNGTGKTQFLAQFARSMSGWSETEKSDNQFFPRRPSFSRVIAVSFSVFDDFLRPPEETDTFSYRYCGIRAADELETPAVRGSTGIVNAESAIRFLSPMDLKGRLKKARESLRIQKREREWKRLVTILLEDSVNLIPGIFESLRFYDGLSSGQKLLVATITQILAHVREQSIILFDEPETHLHPSLLASLARTLRKLLEDFNSYAILATHSPLLLQEALSRQVRIFRRFETSPVVTPLSIESFGENLTLITREIFGVDGSESNFRAELERLSHNRTREQVEGLFPYGLPLQAQAFLQTLDFEKGE